MTDKSVKKSKRGRKPVADAELRKHPVTCRLTDAENEKVDNLRGGMTRGEWLRTAALGKPPATIPAINQTAWLELSRAASNLNQLARQGHSEAVEATEELAIFRMLLINASASRSRK